jgi:type I restriction enzyme M protein
MREIRKNIIEDHLVDCIVNLPTKLFLNTQIPASLWFLSRDKANGGYRNRQNEILFIDARNMGTLINRRTRELTQEDIDLIASTYHNWRNIDGNYEDIPGFCKSATIDEVAALDYVLTPGRYIGLADDEDDFNFEERIKTLSQELRQQMEEGQRLDKVIAENLRKIGIEI